MFKTRKTAVILTLTVAFCFVLSWLVAVGQNNPATEEGARMPSVVGIISNWPIWQITQNRTNKSVKWVDHAPNPRFAIYDAGTPDGTDDVVLDKETGLVWERALSTEKMNWYDAVSYCYQKHLGGRKGWRLPTVEELASLVDPTQNSPALPTGHPFINVQSFYYWSSTTYALHTSYAWYVHFRGGSVSYDYRSHGYHVWCIRGGQGHDALGNPWQSSPG